MTDEMLDLARRSAAEADVHNIESSRATSKNIPLPDEMIDMVIADCVINLSTDKAGSSPKLHECCAPAGAVSDVIADPDVDDCRGRAFK